MLQANETAAVVGEAVPGKKPPKVSVCVVTYNQEKYVAQGLQSIVDQETDFDFEIIVGDDCSTDGTREILENFKEKVVKFSLAFKKFSVRILLIGKDSFLFKFFS